MPRYAILADGGFDAFQAKTGNAILRYRPGEAVAVIDSSRAGSTAQEVLGYGGPVPVVASLDEALRYAPDTLLIGVNTEGGRLEEAWRPLLLRALREGLDVVSGLHVRLQEDEQLHREALHGGRRLVDLRFTPRERQVPFRGVWRERTVPVVLSVGSDANLGKMTTLLDVHHALVDAGIRSTFVATGQTGILIEGRGVSVDALTADFLAGTIEAEVEDAIAGTDPDVVLVEGQGALVHPMYSGITLALLHGTAPDAMVFVHRPPRRMNRYNVRIPPVRDMIRLYEQMAALIRPAPVIGIGINELGMDDETYLRETERIEAETGLPTVATTRVGAQRLADAVVGHLRLGSRAPAPRATIA
ncbi:MAG TPA: DUF1611 domain-containing protein [Longimicrobiaceae bacterium]|nr:DUF1611 domain-containing protein [Longimicrobiaceae bacterium]